MKKTILSALLLLSGAVAFGQIQTPKPSPTATIKQTVGLTDVTIEYSQPGAKGRTIFGDLVSYGEVWRTGANASTKITFSDAVKLDGKDVPAGTYALYTIPEKDKWTVIIHKNTTLWGAGDYNKNEDLIRFTAPVIKLSEKEETFNITFSDFTNNTANINLIWENTKVAIPVEAEIDSKMMAQIKATITDAKGEIKPQDYAGAAVYYLDAEKDLSQAEAWINKAIEGSPKAFWWVHTKAKILAKEGKNKEAIKTAKESMKMAQENPQGDFGYVKNNEVLIESIKGKK